MQQKIENEIKSLFDIESENDQENQQLIKLDNKPRIVIVEDGSSSDSDIFGSNNSSSKRSNLRSSSLGNVSNKSDIRRKQIRVPVMRMESKAYVPELADDGQASWTLQQQ